ncbi:MAG: PDZ domain-containing protein [Sulfurovum sp.]|nr:PDZ domain-containing protein [Sulfurovum sp.]MDD3500194.1 PDZ domain-containing protein [Sulfurovum sp.]
MKHLFKPERMKLLILVLAVILFVKLVWVVVAFLWLPTSGVDYSEEKGPQNLYYRVRVPSNDQSQRVEKPKVLPQGSIKDIDLLGIYSASDITVVTVRHKGKTKVLSKGEMINGFVLEGAGSDFATFSKEEKLYTVTLIKPKKSSRGTGSIKTVNGPDSISQEKSSTDQAKMPSGEIVDAGDRKIVDRSLLTHYTTNMDDIFKDIGIQDMKEGDRVTGFRVKFVRRGSHFAKLGLQRGDIIKSVNGQEINSYNAAFGIFKEVQNMSNMTLVIIRDNKEMELEYEVN